MQMKFDADHLRKLLDLSKAADERRPNLVQMCSPEFWRDDMDLARRAALEEDAKEFGITFEARIEDVDTDKVLPGLWLVGDSGVYMMSNAPQSDVDASSVPHVCYAQHANPEVDDPADVYDAKRAMFGGDDGCEFLDASIIEAALSRSGAQVVFQFDGDSLMLVTDSAPTP